MISPWLDVAYMYDLDLNSVADTDTINRAMVYRIQEVAEWLSDEYSPEEVQGIISGENHLTDENVREVVSIAENLKLLGRRLGLELGLYLTPREAQDPDSPGSVRVYVKNIKLPKHVRVKAWAY